jgi:hypothetical protein
LFSRSIAGIYFAPERKFSGFFFHVRVRLSQNYGQAAARSEVEREPNSLQH